jgi:hypothetical protein
MVFIYILILDDYFKKEIEKLEKKWRKQVFFIEKIDKSNTYVRYDSILKRVKVSIFLPVLNGIIQCCTINHCKIISGVKHTLSFFREEFMHNVSKRFNRVFLHDTFANIIELLLYKSAFNIKGKIQGPSLKEKIAKMKDQDKEKLMLFKDYSNFMELKKCGNCSKFLNKTFLQIAHEYQNDYDGLKLYIQNLDLKGYNPNYSNQYMEIVKNFETYILLSKKKKKDLSLQRDKIMNIYEMEEEINL